MKPQESILGVLVRDLRALQRELEAYGEEDAIWEIPAGIGNSAGTLVLHLTGNLQSFVGATLGGTDYVRDRQAEFSQRHVSRAVMIREIQRALGVVEETLSDLPEEQLEQPYPVDFGGVRVNTLDFLIHLSTHLAFHVGQVDYHRRLVTGDIESIGPVPISELTSVQATD
jgi:uncharacterized damage-inducible protein DinB